MRGSASSHNDNSKRIVIQPGFVSSESIFLLNGLVTIEWSVTEITIEDRYEIFLEAVFQTNVPAPVIVFDPSSTQLPNLKRGEVFHGELRLTNHGLIKAFGLTAALPSSDEKMRYEFFGSFPDELGAKVSITIPYRITALEDLHPEADGSATGGGSCGYSNQVCVNAKAICASGDEIGVGACTHWFNTWSCPAAAILPGGVVGGSTGGGGGGGSIPGGVTLPGLPPCIPGLNCDPEVSPPNM